MNKKTTGVDSQTTAKYPRFTLRNRILHYEAGQVDMYDPDTIRAPFPVDGIMYEHSMRV